MPETGAATETAIGACLDASGSRVSGSRSMDETDVMGAAAKETPLFASGSVAALAASSRPTTVS